MVAPFEYVGRRETCIGCVDVIHAGDLVVPISEERPDRLLCVACWWLLACELPVPGWTRSSGGRTDLSGVFQARPDRRPHHHRRS